jgi:hypothetical protein
MLTKYEGMPLHTLHNPVESHRALLRRKKMLALGLVLAIGIATALGVPALKLHSDTTLLVCRLF